MASRALISEIHCTLSANQERVSSMYYNKENHPAHMLVTKTLYIPVD